jgi:hypothetical protein
MRLFKRSGFALLVSLSTVGAATLLSGLGSSPASASTAASASTTRVQTFEPGHIITPVLNTNVSPLSISAASSSFPHFTSSITVSGTKYTYAIAGKNPAKVVINPASTIKAYLVPVVVSLGAPYMWDPTVADSCDSGASALARTQSSPIFAKQAWTWGGTSIGTGQVTDAFQRAEFWKYSQPTGVNPNYAVNLSLKVLPKITLTPPSGAVAAIGCGNGFLGAIDLNWLDPYLQSTVIPSLAAQGVGPSSLPIFLLHNVVEYQGTTSNCCALGYHNAFTASTGTQTYAVSMYDNSGAFSGSSDISALSHEVAEWTNDPFGTNPTPAWGHIGQVTGCQSNLEVGDPLSGTTFADTVGGFTYHPQQLAFFSWFYHQSPSIGVHGWYSDQGTFTTFAAPCP